MKHILYFAKKDNDKASPLVSITLDQAAALNREGYGIFSTVNGFAGRRRKKDLLCIYGWGIEIDEGAKEEQRRIIAQAPLEPSCVRESKRGYHLVYYAKNATLENYREITKDRLAPFFNGDLRACDVCRVFREPAFYHLKDPQEPFLVTECVKRELYYTEEQIREAFPRGGFPSTKIISSVFEPSTKLPFLMSQSDALLALSGKHELREERFSFLENSNGTSQIVVNGAPTSCWVNHAGHIGSHAKGGPTVLQWVQWYGFSKAEAKNILRKYGILGGRDGKA